ncbi:YkgJ family cysteine cluster protein [Methanolobus sediminis]|uniref:YkgJ family cysteine cluster protein n=1 Tax=Methanolobus sediminis TaxID=3072978 RepID=A0AA51UK61_9EURY|nr:YkgJ family cysteine cluster protein [Methanolobus sediminis]WMW25056.1 YkgJ family cysteine cluster protein [Methanolobus sediminis]
MPISETYEIVEVILSHYSCPSSCNAFCCKIADINLDENDLERLKQASEYKAYMVKSCNEDGKQHKICPPCPFLILDRCSVYDKRPAICRLFPFNICDLPDALLLFPCDMGASIFEDYVIYSNIILKQPISASTIESFAQSHCSFRTKLNEGLYIPMLILKINKLVAFKEYLESGLGFKGNPEIPV